MTHNTGFSFSPSKEPFSFDPSKQENVSDRNLYIPKCGQFSHMKEAYHKQVAEYANNFGMTISYWPKVYQPEKMNIIYGEDTVSGFYNSRKIKAIVDFKQYATFLSKFGYMNDEELTVYIPIREFEKVWGPSKGEIFPTADDIFLVDDSSCDRALGQSPMVFSVTEKDDKVNPVDFLSGHYVWKLNARRYANSYEKNAPEEKFLDDSSSDNSPFGRLEGGDNPPDLSKKYPNIDELVKKNFDNRLTSKVYGGYQ